jgi:hypothetical protein
MSLEFYRLSPLEVTVLDLEPMPGLPAAHIGTLRVLGHHSLKALLRDEVEKLLTLFFDMINVEDIGHRAHDLLQKGLSPDQGQAPQVMAIEVKQVKDTVNQTALALPAIDEPLEP